MKSKTLRLLRNALRLLALVLAAASLIVGTGGNAGIIVIATASLSILSLAVSHLFHRRYRRKMEKRPMINVF